MIDAPETKLTSQALFNRGFHIIAAQAHAARQVADKADHDDKVNQMLAQVADYTARGEIMPFFDWGNFSHRQFSDLKKP
jgi:hypothetical protein